jgi:hypothetical protein
LRWPSRAEFAAARLSTISADAVSVITADSVISMESAKYETDWRAHANAALFQESKHARHFLYRDGNFSYPNARATGTRKFYDASASGGTQSKITAFW